MSGKPKIPFTEEMDQLLIKLYPVTPNKDIQAQTGWTEHMLSYNAERLGLKKSLECKQSTGSRKGHGWSADQVIYLKKHYQTKGDAAIADYLNKYLPREALFKQNTIKKKRTHLKLYRSLEQRKAISTENGINATSSNLWVANTISTNPSLKNALLQHPEIIELKRRQIQLNRSIKEARK